MDRRYILRTVAVLSIVAAVINYYDLYYIAAIILGVFGVFIVYLNWHSRYMQWYAVPRMTKGFASANCTRNGKKEFDTS